jgi:D-glycero-D-manno-heptose 1,7-bisphosphate phosphatase
MRRRAIFLDRDGTVSEEVGYVNHISRLRLLPRTAEAIRKINESQFLAVLVTNQAGVARGYFKEELVRRVHARLEEMLAEGRARLDGIYYCPHHPTAGEPPYRRDCNCRKPKPGMIEAAREDLAIDLSRSFMVGDKYSDIVFAHSVGMKGVLVKTGYGLGEIEGSSADWTEQPDRISEDLSDAVDWILSRDGES